MNESHKPQSWMSRAERRLIVGLVATIFAIVGFLIFRWHGDWARAEAEIDQSDPHWRLYELEADRRIVPDHENSALHCIAVANMGGKVRVSDSPKYDEIFRNMPPNAMLTWQQEELIRTELAKVEKALPEARKLKDMTWGRMPTRFSPEGLPLGPEYHFVHTVVDWLEHDAYLLAHELEIERAWESCLALYNAGDTMGDDPTYPAQNMRRVYQKRAVLMMERILGQGEVSQEQLLTMQRRLEAEVKENRWLTMAHGDLAYYQLFVSLARSGKLKPRAIERDANPEYCLGDGSFVELRGIWKPHFRFGAKLRLHHRLVEIAKLPIHERRPKLLEADAEWKKYANPEISCCLGLANSSPHDRESCVVALLSTSLVALACERYRRTHGSFPESLDDLVQEKLIDGVPTDPFDGQPLRYRQKKNLVVIYSVGADGVDHDGSITENPWRSDKGTNVGFRLWEPRARRQAPPSIVVLPKKK
jgi:hypothetical protein